MPSRGGQGVVRIVTGLEGRVPLEMELVMRFDYGRTTPWVSREDGAHTAIAGPDRLVLRTKAAHRGEGFKTVARPLPLPHASTPRCRSQRASQNPSRSAQALAEPRERILGRGQRSPDGPRQGLIQGFIERPHVRSVATSILTSGRSAGASAPEVSRSRDA